VARACDIGGSDTGLPRQSERGTNETLEEIQNKGTSISERVQRTETDIDHNSGDTTIAGGLGVRRADITCHVRKYSKEYARRWDRGIATSRGRWSPLACLASKTGRLGQTALIL